MSRTFAIGFAFPLLAIVGAFAFLVPDAEGCFRRSRGSSVALIPPPVRLPPVAGDLAITNVTVIDVIAGKALPAQTVVIKGDRIAALGPTATTRAADGTKTIDGTDKFLIPGLWDMHAHIADPAMLGLFLRFGVTGVRHVYSPLLGFPDREKADPTKGGFPAGPRIVATTHLLDGNATGFTNNVEKATTEEDARLAVRKIHKQGDDFLKIHGTLPRKAYFAAADEAKKLKFPFVGHVPYGITVAEASDAGQLTVEHLDGVAVLCSSLEDRCLTKLREYAETPPNKADHHTPWRVELEALENPHKEKAAKLFKKFADNNTWHVPTLVEAHWKAKLGDPKALDDAIEKLLPAAAKFFWSRSFDKDGGVALLFLKRTYTKQDLAGRKQLIDGEIELVRAMHKAKVRLLAGTDTPGPLVVPGISLHEELELLVKAGLTPAEALRCATANPAECLKMTDRFGTITVGKWADLVLLTKDPLADIRNTRTIDTVLVGGRISPRPEPKK